MKSDNFLLICRNLYFREVHPFDFDKAETELYQNITDFGKEYIKEYGLKAFLGFLMEGQYRVNFWAALIALEYGDPRTDEKSGTSYAETVIDQCIDTVERHVGFHTTDKQQRNGENWIKKIKTRYNKV